MCTKEPANLSCLSLSHTSTESDDVMNKQEPCNSCLTHTVLGDLPCRLCGGKAPTLTLDGRRGRGWSWFEHRPTRFL